MSKITSKLQVTVPKALAAHYGLRPGDDIEWVAAGDVIRVIPPGKNTLVPDVKRRVEIFDRATERQNLRQRDRRRRKAPRTRGWTRTELYTRGRAR